MGVPRCKKIWDSKKRKYIRLKHSWLLDGNFQYCAHCRFAKPATDRFKRQFRKDKQTLEELTK